MATGQPRKASGKKLKPAKKVAKVTTLTLKRGLTQD